MDDLKTKILISLFVAMGFVSCIGDTDLTGFIRSTDRIEDRYKISMEYNSVNQFRKLSSETETYSMLIAADAHLGDTLNLAHFLKQGDNDGVKALVLVGDIVTGKEKDYMVLEDLLASHNSKPVFMLTGNHELYFDGWKHFNRLFGSSVYYFSVETGNSEDLFICLDSGSGSIGKSQMRWLRDLLDENRNNYRNCIVLTHNNFFRNRFTTLTNPPENEVIKLMDMFLEYDVNMVVMGHDHVRAENHFGNTKYITMDALADYNNKASYLKLSFSANGLSYEFISLH